MHTIGIKRLLAASALATVLGASANTALAQQSAVLRVDGGNSDGDRTTYAVRCTDGTTGTVYVEHAESKFCAIAQGAKLRCKKNWSIEDASRHACKAASK